MAEIYGETVWNIWYNIKNALQASNNDEKRLIKITDWATDLLSLGLTNIYRMTLDDHLKKELDD